MDAERAILTRRSTRRFLSRQIEKPILERIVEAGRYAPSGGNHQTNHFFHPEFILSVIYFRNLYATGFPMSVWIFQLYFRSYILPEKGPEVNSYSTADARLSRRDIHSERYSRFSSFSAFEQIRNDSASDCSI